MSFTPVRRLAGWLWLASWAGLLGALHAPWGDLGGRVDERLRWLNRVVVCLAVPAGIPIGAWARERCLEGSRLTHWRTLRLLLLPALTATAVVATTLQLLGHRDAASVVIGGVLAYWAGLDAGFAAWPLTHGRGYRFDRPLPPDPADNDDGDDRSVADPFHW